MSIDMGDCNASGSVALPMMQPSGPMAIGDSDAELDRWFDEACPAVPALCRDRAQALADAWDAEFEEALVDVSPDAAALCRGEADAPGAAATSGGRADSPELAALRRRGADAPGGKSPPSPPASPLQEPPSPDLSGRSTVPVAVYTH